MNSSIMDGCKIVYRARIDARLTRAENRRIGLSCGAIRLLMRRLSILALFVCLKLALCQLIEIKLEVRSWLSLCACVSMCVCNLCHLLRRNFGKLRRVLY